MKPVLIVEGKRHNVAQMGFTSEGEISDAMVFIDGVCKMFHNAKVSTIYVENQLLLNFDEAFEWEGLHDSTITALEKRIEAYEERIIEIAQEFIAIFTDEEIPFPESSAEAKSLQKEYREIMGTLEGLYEAKNIIYEMENPDCPFVKSVKQMGEMLERAFKGGEKNE